MPEQEQEQRWTIKVCPSHGPVSGDHCRVVVERTGSLVRYCHQERDVPVIPASQLEGLVSALEDGRLDFLEDFLGSVTEWKGSDDEEGQEAIESLAGIRSAIATYRGES